MMLCEWRVSGSEYAINLYPWRLAHEFDRFAHAFPAR